MIEPERLAGRAEIDLHVRAEMTLDGVFLVLCHYPFRRWRRIDKGSFDLHGHCHGRLAPQPRQVDVGVDVWDFRPVTLAQIHEPRGRPNAAVVKLRQPGQNQDPRR